MYLHIDLKCAIYSSLKYFDTLCTWLNEVDDADHDPVIELVKSFEQTLGLVLLSLHNIGLAVSCKILVQKSGICNATICFSTLTILNNCQIYKITQQ